MHVKIQIQVHKYLKRNHPPGEGAMGRREIYVLCDHFLTPAQAAFSGPNNSVLSRLKHFAGNIGS